MPSIDLLTLAHRMLCDDFFFMDEGPGGKKLFWEPDFYTEAIVNGLEVMFLTKENETSGKIDD